MFKKAYDKTESIISPSTKIDGNFKSNGNVVIGGEIIGEFVTTQALRVEEGAKISANIKAREAVIAGEINGNLLIENHLDILSSAKIQGDIKTVSISVQQGACINGKCAMGNNSINDKKQNLSVVKIDKTKRIVI